MKIKCSFTLWLASTLVTMPCVAAAAPTCQLIKQAEFEVTLAGTQPLIDARINGQPVKLLIDTGSAANLLSRPGASQLHLRVRTYSEGDVTSVTFYGVGGSDIAGSTAVRELLLGDTFRAHDITLLVTGWQPLSHQQTVVGLIGEDFLRHFDIEFDYAAKAIRLLQPKDCSGDQVVYWQKPYSLLPMTRSSVGQIEAYVLLNGERVLAQLDSGASVSVVTPAGARKAGVTPESVSVIDGDAGTLQGLAKPVDTYMAVFPTLALGDEVIKNAKLRVADMFGMNEEKRMGSNIPEAAVTTPNMLLGGDFLRSHRVYVAHSQKKIYFSYEGGPVFDLGLGAPVERPPVPATTGPAAGPAGTQHQWTRRQMEGMGDR